MTTTAAESTTARPGNEGRPDVGHRLSETGQWFDSADGVHWWFDSGCLCLDFAYTGGMAAPRDGERVPNEPWERLGTPADLTAWLHDRFPAIDASCADHELRDALTLREAIANLAYAALDGRPFAGRDVDVVNLYASTPDLPPALAGGSRQAGRTRPRATQALSAIARDAVAVFGAEDARERIRTCGADDCGLVYLDVSRSRNRRWCSMQRCGNRAKVRAHRARHTRVVEES
jgi:predicted RNA-binding Zn ribbon-like protein